MRKFALEVIRHHRLVELYLAEALNVPWDKVHDEAEKWEHVLSEDLEDRIDEILGYPTADPHGALIPARDGTIDDRSVYQLSGLVVGNRATITEVSDEDTDLLRYLGELKLYPQTEIEVISISPIDGVMTIRPCLETGNSGNLVIGQKVASCISVTILQQDEPGKES